MKRLVVIVFSLIFTQPLIAQWVWVNPLPQGNYISDIHLFNSDSIIVVGDAGTIMISNDSGHSWNVQHQIVPYMLFTRITFTNDNEGYALSEYGSLYKSTNGGASWQYSSQFYSYGAYCIKFINETTGFVGGGAIYKTTNKGVSWTMKAQANVRSIDFVNDTLGWAVGPTGIIYKTTNSGETWFVIKTIPNQYFIEADFLNEQFGVIVGTNGAIYKTTNGGLHWTYRSLGTSRFITSVYCKDENNFLAVGDSGLIIKTTNGGSSWLLNNNETNVKLSRIRAIGEKVYITGFYGLILSSDDFGVSWLKVGDEITRESLNSITNIDPGILWVVGNNGTILSSTDSGQNWVPKNLNSIKDLHSVDFVDPLNGWIVGSNGLVISTNDFGETWIDKSPPTASNLESVDFYNYNFGIVVGEDGAIYKTTNGGLSWLNRTTGSYHFTDVFLKDTMIVWIINAEAKVIRSQNGGNSFTTITTLNSKANDILFINPQIGFIACDGGIYKTTDSGNTWLPKSGLGARKLFFVNENFGWGVGENGQIIRTLNSGQRWDTFGGQTFSEKPTDNSLNGVYFKNINQGIAIGEGGTIIKTDNASPTPVELTSFNASITQNKVQLNWETATELNNNGFEVQRKLENSDWITSGFVQGKGTTTEPTSYTYLDDVSDFFSNKIYYRLKQIDYNGNYEFSDEVEVITLPLEYSLSQNYPNPFNPTTKIKFEVPVNTNVTLEVFDILGRLIKTLVNENKSAGRYEVEFNASELSSGLYLYKIKAGEPSTGSGQAFEQTRKMLFLK